MFTFSSMNLCNQTSEAKMLCKMLENPGTYNVKTHRLQEENISHDGSEGATFPAVGFLFDQEIPTYFHPIVQVFHHSNKNTFKFETFTNLGPMDASLRIKAFQWNTAVKWKSCWEKRRTLVLGRSDTDC